MSAEVTEIDLTPAGGMADAGRDRTDAAARLPGWLAAARSLAAAARLDGVIADLRAIQGRLRRPGLNVAVVGESGRGKSTVVRAVLGRDLVPRDIHPPFPILFTPSDTECVEVAAPDGVRRYPPTAATWAALAERPPAGPVRVGLVGGLVEGVDLEIVDTPGDNDRDLAAVEPVRAAVTAADAVVMVVAATAALSLTESRFLVECVGEAALVPHVLLVVSKLDQLESTERDRVLDHVVERARAILPGAAVLPGPDADRPEPVAAIRAWLVRVGAGAPVPTQRANQLAGQVAGCLEHVAAVAREGVRAAALDAEQRRAAHEAAHAELAADQLAFEEYRIELRRRQGDCANRFRGHLQATRTHLVDQLAHEARQSGDPRTWWERDLPYRLRRELTSLAREYEKSLLASVEADLRWLGGRLSQRFGVQPGGLRDTLGALGVPGAQPPDLSLENLRHRKLAYRLGPSGLALIGILLIPGIGPLATIGASVAGTVLGEVRLRGHVDQQRRLVERRLTGVVDEAIDEFGASVAERLRRLYDQVLDEAVRLRRLWYADRAAAIATASTPDADGPDWPGIAARAQDLADEIVAATDGDTDTAIEEATQQ